MDSRGPQAPQRSRPPQGGHPQRLYVPPERLTPLVVLTGEEAHYLLHVKRCRPGDRVELFTGDGYLYRAVVAEEPAAFLARVRGATPPSELNLGGRRRQRAPASPMRARSGASRSSLTLTVEGREPSRRECPVAISVVVPVARARRMDTLVEKLSELGVAELWPVTTTRSVVPTRETATSRYEHWRRLAIEAARQSGRATLLRIREGQGLREAARALRAPPAGTPALGFPPSRAAGHSAGAAPTIQLVASLGGDATPLAEVLSRHPPGDTAIFIGPEGDFDPAELQELFGGGALPVSLGATVLRVETAAIVAVAAVVLWADAHAARAHWAGTSSPTELEEAHPSKKGEGKEERPCPHA